MQASVRTCSGVPVGPWPIRGEKVPAMTYLDADLGYHICGWVRRVDKGEAILLVPAIVAAEIACSPSDDLHDFRAMLDRPEIEQLDVTVPVAMEAGELRRRAKNDDLTLKIPDALVVSTADHYLADYIISEDKDICRLNGRYGIRAVIGRPETGHDQPLFRGDG